MQQSQKLIRMIHCAYPRIPRCVKQAIADSCEDKDDDDGWVGRVGGDDDEGEEFGGWG